MDHDLSVVTGGYAYYVNPCNPLNQSACEGGEEVAACQEYGGGGPAYVTGFFSPNSTLENPQHDGVTIVYHGAEGRVTNVVFTCDKNEKGVRFEGVTENPVKNYLFSLSSQYACPSSSPPSDSPLCCLFQSKGTPVTTKTACTSDSSCPTLTGYTSIGNWHVENCSDCHFNFSNKP
eukprot:CAMPEP_0174262460 /NCGR_PEP_ID=MMETSP0439-20130205/12986_1 /TAXON_ID=0 /ORGANISM="Stereomyxa ramosa, Strain Chinc5" /LENGTH=175 /DNA_ID=CAMNT_0015347169 /DNA_START=161 /DNA_END=688 /DNA_ORIENTATION=+